MIKKSISFIYQMLPKNFQQKILQFNIKRVSKVKQDTVKEFQKKYGFNILIETGTFLGDMVESQRNNFKNIYSIELQHDLAKKARERFKELKHVRILQGDSGKLLKGILEEVNEPAIFWLDAHYSGGLTARGDSDCPIYEEIDVIFEKQRNHVLLIDDARCFNGQGDYPEIDQLTNYIQSKNPQYKVSVENDIIRFTI
jgi:hypothetical protein